MYLLRITPLTGKTHTDQLSYFSLEPVSLGALVEVPYGHRSLLGLVVESNDVRHEKASIKSMDYSLKRIHRVVERQLLHPTFFQICYELADLYHVSLQRVIRILFPDRLYEYCLAYGVEDSADTEKEEEIEYIDDEAEVSHTRNKRISLDKKFSWNIEAFQGTNLDECIRMYKTALRELHAHNATCTLIFPTVEHVMYAYHHIAQSMPKENIAFLHGKLTKKQLQKQIDLIMRESENPEPVHIIATPYYLSLIHDRCDSIFIHEESSPYYTSILHPHIDLVHAITRYCELRHIRCILSDVLLRSDMHKKLKSHEAEAYETIQDGRVAPLDFIYREVGTKKPVPTKGDSITVEEIHAREHKEYWKIFPNKALQLIKKTLNTDESVAIYVPRRGLAQRITCRDCGHIFSCPQCFTPYRLDMKNDTERMISDVPHMICMICQSQSRAPEMCLDCLGLNLDTLGITVERVYEELSKSIPIKKLHTITKNTKKNDLLPKSAACLIGTQRMLSLLEISQFPCRHVHIPSIYHIASQYSFDSMEYAYRLIRRFSFTDTERIYVTIKPEEEHLYTMLKEQPKSFMRKTLQEREELGLFPYREHMSVHFYHAEHVDLKKALESEKDFSKSHHIILQGSPSYHAGVTSFRLDMVLPAGVSIIKNSEQREALYNRLSKIHTLFSVHPYFGR